MFRISAHIERLLLHNDCVIVPDFGGFVLQLSPAVYVCKEHIFKPSCKEMVFNPTLNHNDGLLLESYMQAYGMDAKDAQAALKKDVDELKYELDKNGTVWLGTVGSFGKGDGDALIFRPDTETSLFSVHSYGLVSFYLSPVRNAEEIEEQQPVVETVTVLPVLASEMKKSGRVIHLPVRRVVTVAGMIAAAVAFFLLISTPVTDVNQASYTASFIPSEMLQQKTALPDSTVNQAEKTAEPSEITPVPVTAPSTPEVKEPPKDTVMPAKKAAETPTPVSEASKNYYVIIGSFVTEKQANQFMTELNAGEFKNTGIVTSKENIRVYADKYDNRKDAEDLVNRLRTNEKFKNAWLFISR
ncbi:MAG: SPOR domain-containing protein [Tannerella sp.]|jgi:cell division septation protein DedD|nr:SPOR domain-containing protein [Tannerella sp.]